MSIIKISKASTFFVGLMMMVILFCCGSQVQAAQAGDYTYTVTAGKAQITGYNRAGGNNSISSTGRSPVSSQVQAAQSGDYTYTVIDGKVQITKYTGAGGAVTIPSTLAGFPVTSIGDKAFSNCKGLTSISIPQGVTRIGDNAFSGCAGVLIKVAGVKAVSDSSGSISGTVTDSSGNLLKGISVSAHTDDYSSNGYATTDASGKYTITGLSTGTYKVQFDPYSYNSQNGTNLIRKQQTGISVVQGQETKNINAQLVQGGSISGTVTDSRGNPLSGIDVSAHTDDYSSNDYATTDANGKYSIKGLQAGTYTVEFDPYSYNSQNGTDLASNQQTGVSVVQGQETKNINAQLVQGGSISGTVTDSSGTPLSGINVSAYTNDYSSYGYATTDANGKYAVKCLPTGTYTVRINPSSYNSKNGTDWVGITQQVSVVQGQETKNINAQLVQGGSISGTVTDSSGALLSGINVSAYTNNSSGYGNDTTDVNGEYAIKGLPTGTYTVRIDPSSYNSENGTSWAGNQLQVNVIQGQETKNINVQLIKGGSISGIVKDSSGSPLSGINVDTHSYSGYGYGNATTDANGKYVIKGLPTGTYIVWINPSSYNSQNSTNWAENSQMVGVVAGQMTDNINAQLTKGGSISGMVTDSSGKPLAGIDVSAYTDNSYGGTGASTDANGKYTITSLTTGINNVSFYLSYYNSQNGTNLAGNEQRVCVVQGQETKNINVQLAQGGNISGTVTDSNGKPLSGIEVYAFHNNVYGNGTKTDADGKYTLTGLSAGKNEIDFNPSGYDSQNGTNWTGTEQQVSVVQGQETKNINAQLAQGGSISGTVTDSSGKLLLGIWVSAYINNGYGNGEYTDADGKYSITSLTAGINNIRFDSVRYNLQNGTNWAVNNQQVSVVQGQETKNINAQLVKGGSISGTVTDSSGKPLSGIDVYAYINNHYCSEACTDVSGKYIITSLTAGSNNIQFDPSRYNSQMGTAWVGNTQQVSVVQGQETKNINAKLTKGVTVSVSGVNLNKKVTTINIGANETLIATVSPINATNKNVTWNSSNPEIATVDTNGKVQGVKVGTAVITVTTQDGNKTASCTVTVNDKSAKDITAFTVPKQVGSSAIDSTNHTVTFHMPYGTKVKSLAPIITVSAGATISPASKAAKDFTNQVTYTAKAQDGTTQTWTVTCIVDLNNAKDIIGFIVPGQVGKSTNNATTINATNHTVTFHMPYGTSVTSLVPTITVSKGATINPASGIAQNFTNPISYTVTAENQTTQTWIATCIIDSNSANDITDFTVPAQVGSSAINKTSHSVTVHMPYGTSVNSLAPTISVSPEATISPLTGVSQNFTKFVTYTVTAQNGMKQAWKVTCIIDPNSANDITAFTVPNQVGTSTIELMSHTVTFHVLYGTKVKSLAPTITVSKGATISPGSKSAQNFTNSVTYKVKAQNGTTQTWAVTCIVDPISSANEITGFTVLKQIDSSIIDSTNHTVTFHMPYGTNVKSLAPTITISAGATISPASKVTQNFTNAVTYTVKAQDSTTQLWTVTCVVDPKQ